MSIQRINQYYTEVFEVQTSSGAVKETSLKRYFANLVADYLLLYHKDSNKKLVDEVKLPNLRKQPDGAIIDSINFVFGYWEAKDDADDLEKELQGKINIGYPTENLLIQNQQKGILVRGEIREEFDMQNAKVLDKILRKYLAFEPETFLTFRLALEKFMQDVPHISKVLKQMIVASVEGGVSRVDSRVENGVSRVENTQFSNLNTPNSILNNPKNINTEKDDLQGLTSLAGSHEFGNGSLQDNPIISDRGEIRTDESGQKGISISPVEYSGGTPTEQHSPISTIPVDSKGIIGGSGNTTIDSRTSELPEYNPNEKSTNTNRQDGESVRRIDQGTSKENVVSRVEDRGSSLGNTTLDTPASTLNPLSSPLNPRPSIKNPEFIQKRQEFLDLCKISINPKIDFESIDEMIIQHILTEEIFKTVFNDTQFHEENNIAKILTALEKTFFIGQTKRQTLASIQPYYEAIKAHSTALHTHEQKQDFLKIVYENFYQAYNPKSADKLGIVYTPSEIVHFMIESVDYLLEQNFDRNLGDKGVDILDPATGTGTFITDLIKYLPPRSLFYKYKNEIHANEISILPYYIANLNIEYIYNQRMKTYETFDNLCWVDTLDNLAGMENGWRGTNSDYQSTGDLFAISAENAKRIKAQNDKKISVIIGNPPYNANQQNENDNNKNREYPQIDARIKSTFIDASRAQKTKLYDMYARFYRWAMDRIDSEGIIAFVTNRSFIDSRTFDGFRKIVEQEFSQIHIVDLQGDARANDSKQGGNVFGIMTGVAVAFFIKKNTKEKCKIYYHNIGDGLKAKEKIQILKERKFQNLDFERIKPDAKHNWINLSESNFEDLIPICSKDVKNGKGGNAIFQLFANSIKTNRDEWVYDFSKENLENKIKFFIEKYNKQVDSGKFENNDLDYSIKWSSAIKESLFSRKKMKEFNSEFLKTSLWRPFTKKYFYADKFLNDRLTENHYLIFGKDLNRENLVINLSDARSNAPFHSFLTKIPVDYHCTGDTVCFPLYRYENGEKVENISDWALELFREKYESVEGGVSRVEDTTLDPRSSKPDTRISKLDIFHYVYAVLHNPDYRKTYEIDLKRDFPRIPLYADFWKYAKAGKELMDLHLLYEDRGGSVEGDLSMESRGLSVGNLSMENRGSSVGDSRVENRGSSVGETSLETPSSKLNPPSSKLDTLKVIRKPLESLLPKQRTEDLAQKAEILSKIVPQIKLKVNKDKEIELDELTKISGIPPEVWEYKLGNRSAVEWILDQYKPYKSGDASIQAHFNNYNFADYQEEVIDLLLKVIFVSTETMRIVKTL